MLGLDWRRLLPAAFSDVRVPAVPFYFLVLIAAVSTVRSLIHLFAPDVGAQSIAGIAVDSASGGAPVAIFAQWGASQLVLALIYWVVVLRYRALTPLMLAVIVAEQLLRLLAGHLKPLHLAAPPPGAYYTYALLPVALVMLLWSLRKPAA